MAETDGKYGVKLVRGPVVRLPPHELACDTDDELLALCERTRRPLAADLFCGAGGLSQGLSNAGFEVVIGVDHDDDALATHRAHHPGLSVNWDLGDEDVVERLARLIREAGITLVAGGPPCQPFSRAGRSIMRQLVRDGRRERHDRRRDLWESFLGVIELAEPEAVIMENVPDMALDRGMVIFRTMIERMEDLGYSVEARVVDTWRYGVPQFRQRLILVALSGGADFRWPTEAPERVTVDNAIGDLPAVVGGWRPDNGDGDDIVASGWAEYSGPLTSFQRRARACVPDGQEGRVYDHITRPVREDDAKAFAQMDHTTRYSDLDPELRRYRDDIFDDKYKRLNPDDVSRTITAHIAKDGYGFIHPFQDRTITIREAARLQTFPDQFRFAGPPSSAFRQIGNAVPVLLGQRIGEAVREALEQRRRARVSSQFVAAELAEWFRSTAPVRVPWLAASNRWLVVQAEILWGRMSGDLVAKAWASIRSLETPAKTLDALALLERMATQWGRGERCSQLRETAEWFAEHEDALSSAAVASDLSEAPNVSKAIADLACRVVPGEAEDPVLANYGVLRVAARFHGLEVDRKNQLSDGRLAVARMIGGADESHDAHLALIELANGLCGPTVVKCGHCSLRAWCVEGLSRPVQEVLSGAGRVSTK